MKTEAPCVPVPPGSDAGITIHNHLHPGHRYQGTMDEVFRVALRGLRGPWDVSIYPVDRAWLRVDVIAPNGATWSTSVRADEGRPAEDLADTVRAACVRHCRRKSTIAKRRGGKPADGSVGDRDASPKPPSSRGRAASVPSPEEGSPK